MKQYRDSLHTCKEVQERLNYKNDAGNFQEIESNCSAHGKHSTWRVLFQEVIVIPEGEAAMKQKSNKKKKIAA